MSPHPIGTDTSKGNAKKGKGKPRKPEKVKAEVKFGGRASKARATARPAGKRGGRAAKKITPAPTHNVPIQHAMAIPLGSTSNDVGAGPASAPYTLVTYPKSMRVMTPAVLARPPKMANTLYPPKAFGRVNNYIGLIVPTSQADVYLQLFERNENLTPAQIATMKDWANSNAVAASKGGGRAKKTNVALNAAERKAAKNALGYDPHPTSNLDPYVELTSRTRRKATLPGFFAMPGAYDSVDTSQQYDLMTMVGRFLEYVRAHPSIRGKRHARP